MFLIHDALTNYTLYVDPMTSNTKKTFLENRVYLFRWMNRDFQNFTWSDVPAIISKFAQGIKISSKSVGIQKSSHSFFINIKVKKKISATITSAFLCTCISNVCKRHRQVDVNVCIYKCFYMINENLHCTLHISFTIIFLPCANELGLITGYIWLRWLM